MKINYELKIINAETEEEITSLYGFGQYRTKEAAIKQIRKSINDALKKEEG